MRYSCYRRFFVIGAIILVCLSLWCKESGRGIIEGTVTDAETHRPLSGIHVVIVQNGVHKLTDEKGFFRFDDLSPESYVISFSAEGFETVIRSDIIVRPRRIIRLDVVLKTATPELHEQVTVSGNYFVTDDRAPSSVFHVSTEEVRRAPGSYGDVNRMIRALPGTINAGDMQNDLVVRGGTPAETGYVIENIEVPNLNHFPSMRSSGGRFSALNPDLIQDIDFYTGNFPVEFGDRLSSILNVKLREGNFQEVNGQFDLNFGGAGGVAEGPLPGKIGSWLASYRHSYLQVLEKMGILDFRDIVPTMEDAQSKIVISLGSKHRFSLVDFFARSRYHTEETQDYNEYESNQNSLGFNWQFLWGKNGYSDTCFSYSFLKNRNFSLRQNPGFPADESTTTLGENVFAIRNADYWKVSSRLGFHFGLQIRREKLHNTYAQQVSASPRSEWDHEKWATRTSFFWSGAWSPTLPLVLNLGCRLDHSTQSNVCHISPRISFNYRLSRRWSLHGGYGLFYQPLPLIMPIIKWNWDAYGLPDPSCGHWVLGVEFLPDPSAKLSLEIYDKEYRDMAVSPDFPEILLSDRRPYESLLLPKTLLFEGVAYGRGFEFFFQKKLRKKFYALTSLSISTNRYRAYSETWHDRNYDARVILNITAGYRPGNRWEFSGRWTFVSGLPYTPFDMEKSMKTNQGILDYSRTNSQRLPPYSSLNLRMDRRFSFSGSNLVVYLEVWNVFNRNNVYFYTWDRARRNVSTYHELPIIPLLGLEFEF